MPDGELVSARGLKASATLLFSHSLENHWPNGLLERRLQGLQRQLRRRLGGRLREGLAPVPFIVSLAPCGSIKTMEFMKWLGVSFPRWLENDLRHSADILQTSVELAVKLFAELREYAGEKGIPLGVNVESEIGRASCRERVSSPV